MKKPLVFLIAVLCAGVAVAAPVKPKPKVNTNEAFTKAFYTQIDNANKALEVVINLPCDATDATFTLKTAALLGEIDKVITLTSKIPDAMPELEQVKEIESSYGLITISTKFIKARSETCDAVNHTDNNPSNMTKN